MALPSPWRLRRAAAPLHARWLHSGGGGDDLSSEWRGAVNALLAAPTGTPAAARQLRTIWRCAHEHPGKTRCRRASPTTLLPSRTARRELAALTPVPTCVVCDCSEPCADPVAAWGLGSSTGADAAATLGWVPRTGLRDGLTRTVEWYRNRS